MSVSSSTSSTPAPSPELKAAVRTERRRQQRLRWRDLGLAILTPVVLFAAWELLARAGAIDTRLFIPPSSILERGAMMLKDGSLLQHIGATSLRLVAGFALGAIVGILVGLLMGVSRSLRAALGPLFTALYALPKIAILPLLLLIFGITETPRILAVAISVFFVVQINTVAGITQIDPRILESAKAYQATGVKLFRHVLLPAATPVILTGLRVAAGMSVIVLTAVEFVASNSGLGYLIWNSWELFQPARMFVGLITVALLGAFVTLLISALERIALPYKYAGRPKKRTQKV